jgi:hypothetical protein
MRVNHTIKYHGLSHTIREWADLLGVDYYTLAARIRRGWPVEKALETPLRHKGCGRSTHGRTGSKEYRAWLAMIDRCSSEKYHAYHRYGGRGLAICERWRNSFSAFLEDVGPAPSPDLTLGRVDNDRGYEPGNVTWQTIKEQAMNRARPSRRTQATERPAGLLAAPHAM